MTFKKMGKSYLEAPTRITIPKPPKNYQRHGTKGSRQGLGKVIQVRDKNVVKNQSETKNARCH